MKFKKVIGFENYTIQDDGVLISNKRLHPRWKTTITKDREIKGGMSGKYRNYRTARLTSLNGYSKIYSIHRLVAMHFIPNPDNLPQVNHIDGNTLNNDVSNLEWCDNSHNQRHAYKTGLKRSDGIHNGMYGKSGAWKGKRGDSHNKSKRVIQLDLNGNIIDGYESANLAAEAVGGQAGNISKVCRGLIKKSSGYKWMFATEDHKYLFIDSMK